MKNHKGVVATLLTLGLVLVGTLITLGTSLFVNNQKTNLASNSMAATTCTHRYSDGCNGKKSTSCAKKGNYQYICVPKATSTPTAQPTQASSGGGSSSCQYDKTDAEGICGKNNYTRCQGGTYKCKESVNPTQTPTDSGSGDNSDEGDGIVGEGQSCCFRKRGLIYVFATYDSMVGNEMNLNCSAHSVERSYQAEGPAFVCSGGIQNQTPEDEIDPVDLGEIPADEVPTPTDIKSNIGKKGGPCYPRGTNGIYNELLCNPGLVCSSQDGNGTCGTAGGGNAECKDFFTTQQCTFAKTSGKECIWDNINKTCVDTLVGVYRCDKNIDCTRDYKSGGGVAGRKFSTGYINYDYFWFPNGECEGKPQGVKENMDYCTKNPPADVSDATSSKPDEDKRCKRQLNASAYCLINRLDDCAQGYTYAAETKCDPGFLSSNHCCFIQPVNEEETACVNTKGNEILDDTGVQIGYMVHFGACEGKAAFDGFVSSDQIDNFINN